MSYTSLHQRRNPGNGRPKRRAIWIIAIAAIMMILFVRHNRYTHAVNNGLNPQDTKKQIVLVKSGDSAKSVANILEEKGIIGNAGHLRSYLDDHDLETKILAGRFELSASMPIKQISEIITDAKQAKNFVTIPEGYSIKQIDARLTEMQLTQTGKFIDATKKFNDWSSYPFLPKSSMQGNLLPLEGFLFPDTYKIDPGNFSSDHLIGLMLNNFKKKLPADIDTQLAQKNISLFELITTASMLEKEVRHETDMPIIAGIIWKRSNEGWFLNIDATLLYDLNRQNLTKKDLEQDSPYNTYTRKGMPPGPIGNPGIKTIMASLNPVKTSHWFYITDPKNGKAIFADTNDQQNRNRAKYLQ